MGFIGISLGDFRVNGVATLAKTLLVFYSWAPTSMGQWWRLPQEKNSSQAPPSEKMDPPYDIRLVLCRKLHLFIGKSTKTAATRAALFGSNMYQIVCPLGLRPRPTGGAYSSPQDPLAVFRGPRERERWGGKGEEGQRRRGGGEGVCPLP